MKREEQMKDLKGFLQKAIMTNNMEAVREFYSTIFGETAPIVIAQPANSVDSEKLEAIRKIILNDLVEDSSYEYVEDDIKEDEDTENSGDQRFISSKEFELPEDALPNYNEEVKKLSNRKKQYRDAYKANMRKCEVCSTTFDFNKEYPAGMLQSDSSIKIKCNKCRAK